jgi:hypothetical protein
LNLATLLMIAGAACLGLIVIELSIRRSDVGAALVLGVLVAKESLLVSLAMDAGPVTIFADDIIFVVLACSAAARLLRARRLTTAQWLLLGLGLLVLLSLARGFTPFGIPAAVNQGRKFLQFTAAALYFSTVEPRKELLDRIGHYWLFAAAALCAFALARWAGSLAGLSGGFFGGDSVHNFLKAALPASAALVIAQGAWLAIPLLGDRSRNMVRYLAPVFLVFVVLLQHRTVWVIVLAGTIYLLFLERAVATRVLAGLAAAAVLFAGLMFTFFDDPEFVTDALSSSAQSTGTFEWRIDGWIALVTSEGPDTPEEILIGQPFGTPWDRVMPDGQVVEVSPHSFYVEPYIRVGALGLTALLLVYALAYRGTLVVHRRGRNAPALVTAAVLHTMVAVQLLYFVTYSPDTAQAMLLGLACAVATTQASGVESSPARMTAQRGD